MTGGAPGATITMRHTEIADDDDGHTGPVDNTFYIENGKNCFDRVLVDGNCANQTDQLVLGPPGGSFHRGEAQEQEGEGRERWTDGSREGRGSREGGRGEGQEQRERRETEERQANPSHYSRAQRAGVVLGKRISGADWELLAGTAVRDEAGVGVDGPVSQFFHKQIPVILTAFIHQKSTAILHNYVDWDLLV